MATDPYHPGEHAVQERAGVREIADRVGRKMVRPEMPEQHVELFQKLPFVLIGGHDPAGAVWATVLVGSPGFVTSPDPRTLRIAAVPSADDPLRDGLTVDAPIGLLGIELETRRRNRANGVVGEVDDDGFTLRVQQSFGNCPKFIHVRTARPSADRPGPPSAEGSRLSEGAAALIRSADTLFVATTAPGAGADVSHRGGPPGFVRIDADADGTVLSLPDFAGNAMFATNGNLAVDPRAGLTIVGFATGDLLQLTGTARVVWDPHRFPGAERLVEFRPTGGVWRPAAIPLRWTTAG